MVVRSNWRASPWLVMRNPPLSMIRAAVASLLARSSNSSSSSRWMSSSMSWGREAMSCVLRRSLADELVEQHAGDHVEGFKDAFALVGGGGEGRDLDFAVVEQKLHVFDGSDVGEVAFVVLEDVG